MEAPTLRPKPDRRARPRMSPDGVDRAFELRRQGGTQKPNMGDRLQAEREFRTATPVPSREHAASPTCTAPVDGDIVIQIEERNRMFLYVVTTVSGANQYLSCTAADAVVHALACAKHEHGRAWFRGDTDCVLLEDFRVAGSS